MMKRWRERLGRLDSLFLRLFLLMWVTLVLSQLVAFSVVSPVGMQWIGRLSTDGAAALPPLPSLPPGNPLTVGAGDGAPPPWPAWRPPVPLVLGPEGEPPPAGWGGMPARSLWLDYALRALLIGVGAAIGARWLSVPMRRLAQASTTLSQGLAEGRARPRSTRPTARWRCAIRPAPSTAWPRP